MLLDEWIEIYFSIVQRKVLTPNDFATLAGLEHLSLPETPSWERCLRSSVSRSPPRNRRTANATHAIAMND
jgi:hypothetical protein